MSIEQIRQALNAIIIISAVVFAASLLHFLGII